MELKSLVRSVAPLLDALHDGVVVCDSEGIVLFVNEANERITGLRSNDILERPVAEVAPGSHLLDVLRTREPMVGVRSQVAGREVISNIVPLLQEGRVTGVISVFRDLTEVLGLTAQLQEARNTIDLLRNYLGGAGEEEGVVVGRSPAAQRAVTLALRSASVLSPVLIEGESGTGKEVLARLIHRRSERSARPFIAVNCAAVPGTLIESELFGYEEGAFTGARRGGRAGLLEIADGGTLFLDEVGDMDLAVQAKLLRALQGGEFRRVGGTELRRTDVRIISATNRPLHDLVTAQRFREDLYYRLRVVRILLPPLRDRREDLPLFIDHALRRAAQRLGRPPVRIDSAALRLLLAYDYPGNVRELENILEQALVLADGSEVTAADLPSEVGEAADAAGMTGGEGLTLRFSGRFPGWPEVERAVLQAGLRHFASKADMAAHLGIGRATLYRRLARHGLGPEER